MVDQALEVVEEYQSRILKIEQAVLLQPSMKTVRRRESPLLSLIICYLPQPQCPVHILQGDLILHKRTLEPIKTVIYGLRRYDVDRAMALRAPGDDRDKAVGYMSHKSKIYLVRTSPQAAIECMLTTCPFAIGT